MACIIVVSCGEKRDMPEHIIPEKRMADILVDIHLLESKIDHLGIPRDSSDVIYKALEYDLLTNKYELDTVVYQQSFIYYTKNIEQYSAIYDLVLRSMEKKQKDGF